MNISKRLTNWYLENHRILPWRKTNDPYCIWLSEVILQQTRVSQGLDYYHKFVRVYPTVVDLANAKEDEVLKLWQGLGYYSRARNMHVAAQFIRDELKGQFPTSYNDILKLKGVGVYTAAAISSISFGAPNAVVDGNVYRVLSRVFGITTPIDSTTGKQQFQELAQEILDQDNPGRHNQAIMEFGAIVCTPKSPRCDQCRLTDGCQALEAGKIHEFPVKAKKTKIKGRYLDYLVIRNNGSTYIEKRKGKDIWEGLYQFPLIESNRKTSKIMLVESDRWQQLFSASNPVISTVSKPYLHLLSHQKLHARFWLVHVTDKFSPEHHWKKIPIERVHEYAVPRLIEKYLEE